MKKLFFISILFWANFLFSQNTDWDTALSQIYTPTTGFSPEKVLLDKVASFTDLYNYNAPDYNTSNVKHFQQALSELRRASNNVYFNNPPIANIVPGNGGGNNAIQNIPLGIISTTCSYLNYDEEDNNNGNLTLNNGVFTPISNSAPYFIEKNLLIISPLVNSFSSSTNNYTFSIDTQQLYQYGSIINLLEADFGDGVWHTLISNSTITQSSITINIPVTDVQTKIINFRATLQNGSIISTNAKIILSKKSVNTSQASSGTCIKSDLIPFRSTIADTSGIFGGIEYKTFFGNQNTTCQIRKPIIIVDGFDPDDKRRIEYVDCVNDKNDKCKYEGISEQNYASILKLMKYDNGNKSLVDTLTFQNYDVVLVNFPYYNKIENNLNSELICGGVGDIKTNALSMASFLQKINTDLQTSGSSEKLVVVGPSMGGLVTRYALAYLEKQGINTNTKLWVSMDSPHQGANIPLAVQADIYFLGKKLANENASYKFDNILHSKAAEEMLIDIIDYNGNPVINQNSINFFNDLKSNGVLGSEGYPILNNIKKISITNGSLLGNTNVTPSQHSLNVKASVRIYLHTIFGAIRVGRKRIFAIDNYFTPNKNNLVSLVTNQGRNPEQNIDDTRYGFSYFGNNINGSMDAVPGGSNNSANDLKDEVIQNLQGTNASTTIIELFPHNPILYTSPNLIIDNIIPGDGSNIIAQAFIPMHSALDTHGFSNWYQPINKNISCSGQTKFNSFYGETYNMGHVSFTPNMVKWLLKSITEGIQDPVFPLTDTLITGNSVIAVNSTSNYTFDDPCKIPGNVSWSLSNTNAQIISSTSTSITIKGIVNGAVILTATFQNGQTLTKTIWIGVPNISITPNESTTNYVTVSAASGSSNASLEDMGLTPTNVVWKRLDNGQTRTGYTYSAHAAGYNWSFDVEIKATNSCGTFTTYTQITPRLPDDCSTFSLAGTEAPNNYIILKSVPPDCPIDPNNPNRLGDQYQITVANSMGTTVISKTGDTFDLSPFPTGMYVVNIQKDNQVIINQTIIKN